MDDKYSDGVGLTVAETHDLEPSAKVTGYTYSYE